MRDGEYITRRRTPRRHRDTDVLGLLRDTPSHDRPAAAGRALRRFAASCDGYRIRRVIPSLSSLELKLISNPSRLPDARMYVRSCASKTGFMSSYALDF